MSSQKIWTGPYPDIPGLEALLNFNPTQDTVLSDGNNPPGLLVAYKGTENRAPRSPVPFEDIKLPRGMNEGKALPTVRKRGRPRKTNEELIKRKKETDRTNARVPSSLPPGPNLYQETGISSNMVAHLEPLPPVHILQYPMMNPYYPYQMVQHTVHHLIPIHIVSLDNSHPHSHTSSPATLTEDMPDSVLNLEIPW